MRILRYLLFPFSTLYLLITQFRNHLFDIGYTRSFKFEVKTIGVGNLSVGGTGKTPMIEYLIRILKDKNKLATISRGYGRRSKGFILANDARNSSLIGDEPRQFYLKFKDEISVCVGEDRALAIPELLFRKPETEVVLLDDAFQHRQVIAGINILVSDYKNIFYKDFPLPLGNLRESRKGAKRADIIVISKCPEKIDNEEMLKIKKSCYKYVKKEASVFFTTISYLQPVPVFEKDSQPFHRKIFMFSGIGKSSYMEQYVRDSFDLLQVSIFPDHYKYTIDDLMKIKKQFNKIQAENKSILTSEKDMIKIKELDVDESISELPLFYLPIKVKFIAEQNQFDELIFRYVSNNTF